MANSKKKEISGEERFVATGKSVTLLSTPKKAATAKQTEKQTAKKKGGR